MTKSTGIAARAAALVLALACSSGCFYYGVRSLDAGWKPVDSPRTMAVQLWLPVVEPTDDGMLVAPLTWSWCDDESGTDSVELDAFSVGLSYFELVGDSQMAYVGAGFESADVVLDQGGMKDSDTSSGGYVNAGWSWSSDFFVAFGFEVRYHFGHDLRLNSADVSADGTSLMLLISIEL